MNRGCSQNHVPSVPRPHFDAHSCMGRVGRILRPAFEQAVRLVRESSDWNPPLKSAAGGVACILEQARVRTHLLAPGDRRPFDRRSFARTMSRELRLYSTELARSPTSCKAIPFPMIVLAVSYSVWSGTCFWNPSKSKVEDMHVRPASGSVPIWDHEAPGGSAAHLFEVYLDCIARPLKFSTIILY